MILAIDYFLLLSFCFSLAVGLFIALKSIKLI